MNPKDQLTKARAGLLFDHPFFGALTLRLQLEEKPGLGTVATDGRKLYFDPRYVADRTLEETKALWAEEVLHCGLSHHLRRGERDKDTWNLACDQAIFSILQDAGFRLPKDVTLNPAYKGKSAEDIYLSMSQKPKQDQDQGGQGSGSGSGQDQAQGSPSAAPGGPDQDKGKGSGQGSGKPQGRQPGQGWGDVLDGTDDQGKELSHSDLDQAENEWKIAMNQAAQVAKAQGNLPADLARMVQELINPRIPWVEQLRNFLELIARNDYNFSFPSRRYLCGGIYLPSLRSQELPEIVMVLDTSDSITQREFDLAAAEVTGLLDAYDTTVHVVYCSNRVTKDQTFTRADYPLKFEARGRGGTDFRPAFQWVDDQGITPAVLIYLTDLECSRYPSDPGYPVIWARVDHGRKVNPPPFGEIIEIGQF